MYDSFDEFLKAAIQQSYDRGWKHRKGTFLALLLASGQALSVAVDSVKSGEGLKKVAYGAAGVVALRLLWRFVLGGPLGLLLSAAAVASLGAYLLQNRGEVGHKLTVARRLIEETRGRFDEIQGGYRAGRHSQAERNLMIDGLLKGFLERMESE
jgi:hypothetical protein